MRFKVIFHLNNSKFPIIYRNRFISFFKLALEKENVLNYYYNAKKPKPFTFALITNAKISKDNEKFHFFDYEIEVNYFILQNKSLSLIFSTYDYEFGVYIYNGILKIKEFKFSKEITLYPRKILLLNEPKFDNNEYQFKTISPILIENKEDKPILPSNENFISEFNNFHRKIFESFNLTYEDLEIDFLSYRKVVVKHFLESFKEKTNKNYMFLTCFEGIFKIKGNPKVIEFLYKKGIGNRTSQGFGCVDISLNSTMFR
ncbi:MAG: CRISPR-associated endoribonuclease Cas6 [Candidatus Hydrothermia bacterium]|jgi:CRISPR-associated endoribonuclease Cas6|nr:CRISPR-associated endoribonuclease Cas6 [Candidatus Hydrothermia bacterium]